MLNVETRVGLLLLATLGALVGFVLLLGHVRLTPGIAMCADFAFAGHLQQDAPVRLSGMDAGYVKRIELLAGPLGASSAPPVAALGRAERPHVRAVMRLDQRFAPLLQQGCTFAVATTGVIGETYLEVVPAPRTDAPPLAEGSVVRGVDAPRLHVMALQMQAVMQTLDGLLTNHAAPGDAGQAMVGMLGTLNDILATRKETLGHTLDNLSDGAADARVVLQRLRATVGDGAQLQQLLGDTCATVATARPKVAQLLEQSDALLTQLTALGAQVQGGLDPNAVSQMFHDATRSARNVEQATADAARLIRRVDRGEGTVGGLVQDPQIYDDIKELLRDLKRHPWKVLWRN